MIITGGPDGVLYNDVDGSIRFADGYLPDPGDSCELISVDGTLDLSAADVFVLDADGSIAYTVDTTGDTLAVSVVVPEPDSLEMLVVGLLLGAAFCFWPRKRKKR